jgi:CDP-4-dehydro-6-deoxyglucose reductase, E3
VLACAHTAASSELTIETLEAQGPADIPQQQIVTTVRAVRPLAPDTLLLHLQTPRSHRLRFLAGQWVTLGVADGEDAHAQHCRSPAAPATTATCTSSSRGRHRCAGRALFGGRLKPGDAVTVWGPAATSCSPRSPTRWSSPPATPASRR